MVVVPPEKALSHVRWFVSGGGFTVFQALGLEDGSVKR